ncbi:MAG TPA: MBL fold metallo-hydrolase [Opitutaceae bacterium]
MKTKSRLSVTTLLLCVAGLLGLNSTAYAAAEAGVYFIKLGGKGNATVVKTVNGSTASYGLVDTGTSSDYTTYVAPYLSSVLGSGKLTFIALSHLHSDHMGGASAAIASFADANTTLYIKDVADPNSTYSGEATVGQRADTLINAAKAKSMPIGKVKPYEAFDNDVGSMAELTGLPANKFKARIERFTKNANGSYVSVGLYDTVTFGKFTMTWYNGNNWNHESIIEVLAGSWDENLNSATILLKCTTSTGTNFRAYLGADLGENSNQGYSYEVAKRVQDIVGPVSVYQVAHHGYYFSLKPNSIAGSINPKYAIVTNSYNDIVNTYYENKDIDNPTSADLTDATSTLKETLNSTVLQKMYFLNGKGAAPDNRIINALEANNYALLNWTGTTIKSGNVNVEYSGTTQTVTQP